MPRAWTSARKEKRRTRVPRSRGPHQAGAGRRSWPPPIVTEFDRSQRHLATRAIPVERFPSRGVGAGGLNVRPQTTGLCFRGGCVRAKVRRLTFYDATHGSLQGLWGCWSSWQKALLTMANAFLSPQSFARPGAFVSAVLLIRDIGMTNTNAQTRACPPGMLVRLEGPGFGLIHAPRRDLEKRIPEKLRDR